MRTGSNNWWRERVVARERRVSMLGSWCSRESCTAKDLAVNSVCKTMKNLEFTLEARQDMSWDDVL